MPSWRNAELLSANRNLDMWPPVGRSYTRTRAGLHPGRSHIYVHEPVNPSTFPITCERYDPAHDSSFWCSSPRLSPPRHRSALSHLTISSPSAPHPTRNYLRMEGRFCTPYGSPIRPRIDAPDAPTRYQPLEAQPSSSRPRRWMPVKHGGHRTDV